MLNHIRMKLLRALVNSLLSGLFFSLLLALLIADLNINLRLDAFFLSRLTLSIAVFYGILMSLITLLAYFMFQFFSGGKARPGLVSPSFLQVSFSLIIAVYFVIFKTNHDYFLPFFDPAMKSIHRDQMIILGLLFFVGLALLYGRSRYGKNFLFFPAYFICFAASLTLLFSARWKYLPPTAEPAIISLEGKRVEKKVIILGMEGLSLEFIIPLASEGKVPNFSWLLEKGSWGRLMNFTPNEPFILKNSFETGKLPAKHRQIADYRYRFLNMEERLEVVPRFILFKQLTRVGALEIIPSTPDCKAKGLWEIFDGNRISYLKKDRPFDRRAPDEDQKAERLFNNLFKDLIAPGDKLYPQLRRAFFSDWDYQEEAIMAKEHGQPQVYYLLLDGLKTVESLFYKYSFPQLFGDIDQEVPAGHGRIIEKYYQFYGQIIGGHLKSLKEDELLIVFSPHGIEALPLWKRFVEWVLGNPDASASHEFAPDGAVFFYGKGVNLGKTVEDMSLVDIAPTILYALGLPVGKDMDGIVRSSLFVREFTAENPVFYISSYDEVRIEPPR